MKNEKRLVLADDTALKAATDKLAALQRKQAELEKEMAEATNAVSTSIMAAADDLLAGKPQPPRIDVEAIRTKLGIISQAVRLQTQAVEDARRGALSRLHTAWREYRKPILDKLAEAVGGLLAGYKLLADFDDDLAAAGGTPDQLPFALPTAGNDADFTRQQLTIWLESYKAGQLN